MNYIQLNNETLVELYDRASLDLPEGLNKRQSAAWVAKRMLEISERDRRNAQTVQALLATWIVNGDLGAIWMEHPKNYSSFREFLRDVGTERDGNQLSQSSISDMVAIAEIIVPKMRECGIEVNGYITSDLWTKFREAIPALRAAEDKSELENILNDVKSFPTRDAVIAKYRQSRTGKIGKADRVRDGDKTIFKVVVPSEYAQKISSVLGRYVDWEVL